MNLPLPLRGLLLTAGLLSGRQPPPVPAAPVLRDRSIDGTGAAPLADVLILAAGKIQYVGPAAGHPYPADAQVLDVGEGAILPGLILVMKRVAH